MKLRQKSKRDQALDAVASIAKTWSEWRLGEKVSTTASKASKKASKGAGKASKKAKKQTGKGSAAGATKRTRVKIVGVVALGGIGAAVAKKLAGGKAEPLYTPTGSAPDTPPPPPPPPSSVAVEHAQDAPSSEPTSVPASDEPALTAPKDVPPRDPSPVVVGDLASDAPAGGEEPGSEDVEAAPLAEDHPPSTDDAPDPENLISETADEPDAGAPPDKAT